MTSSRRRIRIRIRIRIRNSQKYQWKYVSRKLNIRQELLLVGYFHFSVKDNNCDFPIEIIHVCGAFINIDQFYAQ
jgi:hypothetical protein